MSDSIAQPAGRSVTLGDIAERAGVSLNTVSRVLSGQAANKHPKAKRRAEYIRSLASEMNYRVNTAARATASGKFQTIGLLFRDDGSAVGSSIVSGANTIMRESDQRLLLSPIHRREDTDDTPSILKHLSVDGLLISLMQDVPDDFEQTVEYAGHPAIWINAKLKQNSVRPDDHQLAKSVTQHLLSLGHRRIVYLGRDHTRTGHYSVADRLAGFEQAMADASLSGQCLEADTRDNQASLQHAIQQILTDPAQPTAVVCESEVMAIPLLYAAARQGLRVPDDLSVAAVFNSDRDMLGQELSGIQVPFRKIGEVAAMMLLERIRSGQDQPSQRLTATISPGRTVGPCHSVR